MTATAGPDDLHAALDGPSGPRPALPIVAALVLAAYALLLALGHPVLFATSDTWAYQELADGFARGEPYRIVVQRSYWSDGFAASFPPGYPFLLYLLQLAFGPGLYNAIALNLVAVAATPWASAWLARRLGGSARAGWFAGLALALYAPYLFEAICGRALPVALLCAVAGLASLLGAQRLRGALLGGLLLGTACMVRFDQPPLLIAALAWALWRGVPPAWVAGAAAAALLTLAPWIAFSWTHFGLPWASDNAWVATASVPAFVSDFPAAAAAALWDDPLGFVAKCLGNAALMLWALVTAVLRFPVLALAALAFAARPASGRTRAAWGLVAVALFGLAPLVATGYVDVRYFSFLLWALLLALLVEAPLADARAPRFLLIGLLLNLVVGVGSWGWDLARDGEALRRMRANEVRALALLERCNAAEPEVRYVFFDTTLAARYGAVHGRRAAFAPRNLERLDAEQLTAFERRVAPLRYVPGFDYSRPPEQQPTECGHLLSERVPAR